MSDNEADNAQKGDCASVSLIASNAVETVKNSEPVQAIGNSSAYKHFVAINKAILSNVGDLLTGGLLITQTKPFVYGAPLGGEKSLEPKIKALAVAERSLMFSESFQVQDMDEAYCEVKGRKMHIVTTPMLHVYRKDEWVATLATKENKDSSKYYEVLRGETKDKIGWIEKVMAANGKDYSFQFYAGTKDPDSDVRPPVVYELQGDFLSRRFVMRNTCGEAVAKVTKQLIAFAAFDHYVVRIAAGMDPILVIACTLAIDEELDEQLKKCLRAALKTGIETLTYDVATAATSSQI